MEKDNNVDITMAYLPEKFLTVEFGNLKKNELRL